MQLGSFSVYVIVDGRPLEEYDVVYDSPTNVTCWIASEEGKPFCVEWKCYEQPRVKASRANLSVDGTGCCSATMLPVATPGASDTITMSHFVDVTTVRGLMFTRVQLSDDDSLLTKAVPTNLGEICLQLQRGAVVPVERHYTGSNDNFATFGDNKFHERSKKATVHCVGFGPPVKYQPPFRWQLFPSNDPELTFTFKYQTLSMLQANGIVPTLAQNDVRADQETYDGVCYCCPNKIAGTLPAIGITPQLTQSDASTNHEINCGEYGSEVPNGTASPEDFRLHDRIHDLENELKRLRELASADSEDRKPKRIKIEESGERKPRVFARG